MKRVVTLVKIQNAGSAATYPTIRLTPITWIMRNGRPQVARRSRRFRPFANVATSKDRSPVRTAATRFLRRTSNSIRSAFSSGPPLSVAGVDHTYLFCAGNGGRVVEMNAYSGFRG
jgi:hypothetical protein